MCEESIFIGHRIPNDFFLAACSESGSSGDGGSESSDKMQFYVSGDTVEALP